MCAHVTPIATTTRVIVLQHPRERHVAVGTARMAAQCLPDAELHLGVQFDDRVLARLHADPRRPPVLLFPGPGARDLATEPPEGPVTLVVVDGTWPQARQLVRKNPALASLPRYAFEPPAPSTYRIRREPDRAYLSTIESLAHALGILERDAGRMAALQRPFDAMVERQLAYAATPSPRHKKRAASPRVAPVPAFVARAKDVVCIVAEVNALSFASGLRAADDPGELVHCAAYRLATDERFEQVIAPRTKLSTGTPDQLEMPEGTLRGGVSLETFHQTWAAFRRPDDILVYWGTHAPRALARSGVDLGAAPVDLRRELRLASRGKVGTIDQYHQQVVAEPSGPMGLGRGGRRLGALSDLTRHLVLGRPLPR